MAVTLGELKLRALDYADMGNSAFPDSERLTNYINSGLSRLHDMLVDSYADYYRKTKSYTLVVGTEEYELPSDFLKASKVFYVSGSRRYRIERFELNEIDGYKTTGAVTSGTVELWYYPQLTKLVNDIDSIEIAIPVGWEEYVALHAAIRLLIREESDPGPLMAEREEERQRIMSMAEPRDAGEPKAISDSYGRWATGYSYIGSNERHYKYRIMGNKIHFVELESLGA